MLSGRSYRRRKMDGLTPAEEDVLKKTMDLWNAILQLPEDHHDDVKDFRFHVHAIQNLVASRPVFRDMLITDISKQAKEPK